jgi:pyridoxamine 5'-phosphate oxidase
VTLIDTLGPDPLDEIARWIADAAAKGRKEPNAMALATATKAGVPSVRIVLAKGIEAGAVQFFTNYESRKGREIEANPEAAATFLWADDARQIRIEGRLARLSRAASEAYFATRARGSQLSAWASPQSRELPDYAALLAAQAAVEARFGDGPVPCPPHWGGFGLTPRTVEFWQGLPSRLHDRVLLERAGDRWTRRQLAP